MRGKVPTEYCTFKLTLAEPQEVVEIRMLNPTIKEKFSQQILTGLLEVVTNKLFEPYKLPIKFCSQFSKNIKASIQKVFAKTNG